MCSVHDYEKLANPESYVTHMRAIFVSLAFGDGFHASLLLSLSLSLSLFSLSIYIAYSLSPATKVFASSAVAVGWQNRHVAIFSITPPSAGPLAHGAILMTSLPFSSGFQS